MNGTKPLRDQMLSVLPINGWKETRLTQDQRGQVHNVHRIIVRPDDPSSDFWRGRSGGPDRPKDLENLLRTEFIA